MEKSCGSKAEQPISLTCSNGLRSHPPDKPPNGRKRIAGEDHAIGRPVIQRKQHKCEGTDFVMFLKKHLGEKYTPLYLLASLGAGGMAVAFYLHLMFLTPHPKPPVPT